MKEAGSRKQGLRGRAGLIWLVLAGLVVVAAALNAGDLKPIFTNIRSARPEYLALAAVVQLLFVLNLARFYASTFEASGLEAGTLRFVLVTSASNFVNLVSNTSGLGGLAIYLREAERNHDHTSRVSAAYLLAYALGYVAFFGCLIFALALLQLRHLLTPAEATAAAVVMVIALVITVSVTLGLRSRSAFARLLTTAASVVNRPAHLVLRRDLIDPDSARTAAGSFYEAVAELKQRPRALVVPFGHALLVEGLSALLLLLVARAMHSDVSFAVALICYTFSLLFSLIAFTPGGIGLVEASLSVLLISFGMPRAEAIATALVFRAFDFWLPILLGLISLALLRRPQAVPA